MKISDMNLHVQKVIVHEIPAQTVKGKGGGTSPVLSDIESPLTEELKTYVVERITDSLVTAAYDVAFDTRSPSPVPSLVLNVLGTGKKDFVNISKRIAEHLYKSQTALNPSGLLVVVQISDAKKNSLAILKLEKEEGVRIKRSLYKKKNTFNVELVRNLMLTERTKVFKVGLFVQNGSDMTSIEGIVSDKQRGYYPKTEVARFFISTFLGCMLIDEPSVITKRYFEATETFINTVVTDPPTKADYQLALMSDLKSQDKFIDPKKFAEKHIKMSDRKAYQESLSNINMDLRQFEKDLSLIAGHLAKIQLNFKCGISIIGPPGTFEEQVELKQLENNVTRASIEDEIDVVKSRR